MSVKLSVNWKLGLCFLEKKLFRFWILYFFPSWGNMWDLWGLEWLVQRNGVLMKPDQMSLERILIVNISFHSFSQFIKYFIHALWCEKVFWSLSQLFCNLDYYLTSTFSKINGATCYYVKLNQHKTFLIKNASSHIVEIAEIYSYLFSKKLREVNLLST